jgi:hypothetical protein
MAESGRQQQVGQQQAESDDRDAEDDQPARPHEQARQERPEATQPSAETLGERSRGRHEHRSDRLLSKQPVPTGSCVHGPPLVRRDLIP